MTEIILLLLSIFLIIPLLVGLAVVGMMAKLAYKWEDKTVGEQELLHRMVEAEVEQMVAMRNEARFKAAEAEMFGELVFGEYEAKGITIPLSASTSERSTHCYVIGATGTGKSSLLHNLIVQDIQEGRGVGVIDPHGDLVDSLLPFTEGREREVVLIDAGRGDVLVGFNPLERKEGVSPEEQVAKLILAFKRIWEDSWGPRMEDILRHTLELLIYHKLTLLEFERVLTDGDFRDMLVSKTEDKRLAGYFQYRYEVLPAREKSTWIESSLNKVSAFLADKRIRHMLAQEKSTFDMGELMLDQGILLVNLSKGRLGSNADLLGALLMATIEMATVSRKKDERTPFYLYIDEFQNIATESFAVLMNEARKFGLSLTLAHQSLAQLPWDLTEQILASAGTQVCFRISRKDAERLARESTNVMLEKEETEMTLSTPEEEFHISLQEQWELCFNKLMSLPQRNAGFFQKGKFEKPVLFTVLPMEEREAFPELEALGAQATRRAKDIRKELDERERGIDQRIEKMSDTEEAEDG